VAFRIRPALPEDWEAWRDLRLAALAEAPDAFGESSILIDGRERDDPGWRTVTAAQRSRILLFAERDGHPVGMVVARVSPRNPREAQLYGLWVAPEARRGGAGRMLIDAAMRWARFAGAAEISGYVRDDQAAARQLYRGAGFGGPSSDDARQLLVARLGPLVMGVLNVTPDSFSDGGQHVDPEAAVSFGIELMREGADIIDVGGEATNPRARLVGAAEELRRVLPVIQGLVEAGATVSIDTTKAQVARAAVATGARIVNDVSGGLFDPAMPAALAELDATFVLGHLRGRTLTEVFAAETPVGWREVAAELGSRLAALPAAARARAWVDPGIGFGKGSDPACNLDLLRHAGDLGRALGAPVVVGPSRKRFLRKLLGTDQPEVAALDAATVAACLGAARAGAHVLRVHNVALLRAALAVYTKL